MSVEHVRRNVSISWGELDGQSRELAVFLRTIGKWDGIIAVARGGLVPAATIAYELDIRLIDTLCVESYVGQQSLQAKVLKAPLGNGAGLLVIEDIVDTGQTAKIIRQRYPKAYFATIFAKPMGKPLVDKYLVEVAQDTWVTFPWDAPLALEKKLLPNRDRHQPI